MKTPKAKTRIDVTDADVMERREAFRLIEDYLKRATTFRNVYQEGVEGLAVPSRVLFLEIVEFKNRNDLNAGFKSRIFCTYGVGGTPKQIADANSIEVFEDVRFIDGYEGAVEKIMMFLNLAHKGKGRVIGVNISAALFGTVNLFHEGTILFENRGA